MKAWFLRDIYIYIYSRRAMRGVTLPPPSLFLFFCLPCCAPLRRSRFVEVETSSLAHPTEMPPNRLVTLLQQAVAFQIDRGRYYPKASSACVPLVAFCTQNGLLVTRTINNILIPAVCTWYLVSKSSTVGNIHPTAIRWIRESLDVYSVGSGVWRAGALVQDGYFSRRCGHRPVLPPGNQPLLV